MNHNIVWYYEDIFNQFLDWLSIDIRYPDRFREYFDPKYKLRVV